MFRIAMLRSLRCTLVSLLLFVVITTAFSPEVHKVVQSKVSSAIVYMDDAPVVFNLDQGIVYRSSDAGKTWDKSLENIDRVQVDPVKKERVFAFTVGNKHYVSNNRGESWSQFGVAMNADFSYDLSVNYKNPDHALLAFLNCDETSGKCTSDVFYTEDGFRSDPILMMDGAVKCVFTKSTSAFTEGHDSRVICLKTELDKSGYLRRSRLLTSTDFFEREAVIINDVSDSLANGVVYDLNVIQSFVVAVVQNDRYDDIGSSVQLYVSKDGLSFNKAVMTEDLVPYGFSFLESTPDSLHISVWGLSDNVGLSNILASDSDGIHYRTLLSRVETSALGFADIDKVETIEGVWIASIMIGYDQSTFIPLLRSKISFDDGNTWHFMKTDDCSGDAECSLNLMSVEQRRGDGQGSTGQSPGILLGIGNTGDRLGPDLESYNTYVSRDGGYSWKKTLDEPTIFSFGDLGNVIVAAPYVRNNQTGSLASNKLYFSLDQGSSWETVILDDEVFPFLLTTAIDGTSTSFLYGGIKGDFMDEISQILYSFDFSKAFAKTCEESDYEEWYGRSQGGNAGTCIFGHKDIYKRRKADAQCFMNKNFEDLKIEEVPCECTDADYECSFGFVANSQGDCVVDGSAVSRLCSVKNEAQLTLQKKKKITGNLCTGGSVFIEEYIYDCNNTAAKTESIVSMENSLPGKIIEYVFMEQSEFHRGDETVFIRTSHNEAFISHDGGTTLNQFRTDDEILRIYLNPYFKDHVYFTTANDKIYFSTDRGTTFTSSRTPSDVTPYGSQLLTFSNSSSSTLIFYGSENCENSFSESCIPVAFISEDFGLHWDVLLKRAVRCGFVSGQELETDNIAFNGTGNLLYPFSDPGTILCQVYEDEKNTLVSSTDKFVSQKRLFDDIVGFITTTRFIVVAAKEVSSLKSYVSVDGDTFAAAQFPNDFVVSHQQAYTILGSETGAIFFHVTTNDRQGSEFGAILKSNANGTSYVLSERYVNRNEYGYVDYEKIEGLEGIAIINTVKNYKEAKQGSMKQLQSKITFNDGSDWDLIQPPFTDSKGNKYACIGKPLKECSLHLHGYTERKDTRDTFSSGSATGLLLAVGNVGDTLGSLRDASTFITRDGGSTWKEIKKGAFQWEFGDRGSIIVLVDDEENTNTITYSLDEGQTWDEYKFTEDTVKVDDIVTVPSDTSKKFLLITRSEASKGDESRAFVIDFQKVFSRQCILDLEHPDKDDFEFWTPKHPFESSPCLFGHEAKYLRKIPDRIDCFIGSAPLAAAFKIERDCPCTRRDFECDYNYVKADDGTCKLVPGLDPEDHSEICRTNQNAIEFFEPTGYRRIPMTTCKGGQEFDKWDPHPCPGKEHQFYDEHGAKLKGFGWFMVVVVPILVFVGATWFVYDRGIRRNGGFARFGEIRLGEEDDLIENNVTDKIVNTIVRGGISVIAAFIATYNVIKMTNSSLIDRARGFFRRDGRYSTRGATFHAVGESDFRDEAGLLDDVLNDDDYDIDDDADLLPGDDTDTRLDDTDNNPESL